MPDSRHSPIRSASAIAKSGLMVTVIMTGAVLAGCSAPFLHPPTGPAASDPGLIGQWATDGDTVTRALVSPTDAKGKYRVDLTIHDKGELRTELALEASLVGEAAPYYLDLFLAEEARKKLANTYGHLVLPVHQIVKLARDGDRLRIWQFDERWLARESSDTPRGQFAIGDRNVTVVTAPANQVRALLDSSRDNPDAFTDPLVFERVRK
jgi:hypothetical protein